MLVKGSLLAIHLVLLLHCGYQDVTRRRVRNSSVILLGLFSLGAISSLLRQGEILQPNEHPGLFLVWLVTAAGLYILYSFGMIGAADVKVIAVSSLFGYGYFRFSFSIALVLLYAFDLLWHWKFEERGARLSGTPLVWLWFWANCFFAAGILGRAAFLPS